MTGLSIVGFWASLILLMHIFMTLRVGSVRVKNKISLGDGGNPDLLARIRAHGNFIEIVPLPLIGLVLLVLLSAHDYALHGFGALLLLGRIFHLIGMGGKHNAGKARPIGMLMSLFAILGIALYLLFLAVTSGGNLPA
ncbi:MAPEG family protein [Robiginitomaculum antarcticum]|uniref:MAPEG family protein n=1 Tax=Robiginitomaculum antarcticum TaxID=437507 RepID=UPI000373456A|nr:MAPEG family protein [Robiginitomaculum antarcticum]